MSYEPREDVKEPDEDTEEEPEFTKTKMPPIQLPDPVPHEPNPEVQ